MSEKKVDHEIFWTIEAEPTYFGYDKFSTYADAETAARGSAWQHGRNYYVMKRATKVNAPEEVVKSLKLEKLD